jgi:hypothetical protein
MATPKLSKGKPSPQMYKPFKKDEYKKKLDDLKKVKAKSKTV